MDGLLFKPDFKVAVIVVNWNGGRFLERCLSALGAQTLAPQEIILVDNASTDSSTDIVRRFPSVRLLAQRQNLGFAQANNLAVFQTSADVEWIALLNPDAFPEPRWLEALMKATLEYPDFAAFGSRLLSAARPDTLDGVGDMYHISGLMWRKGYGKADNASGRKGQGNFFALCSGGFIS